MIIFFTIIVFIAEVIITCQLVSFIKKIDDKVIAVNNSFVQIRSHIKKNFCSARIGINSLALAVNNIQIKISEKKNKYKILFIKHLISLILLLTLNFSGKKVATAFDLFIALRDFLKLLRKSAYIFEI